VAAFLVGTCFAGTVSAKADGHCGERYTYRRVTTYEVRRETHTQWVNAYTSCGRFYRRPVVQVRLVRVPVIRIVRVSF
jgi:hypothetical protein